MGKTFRGDNTDFAWARKREENRRRMELSDTQGERAVISRNKKPAKNLRDSFYEDMYDENDDFNRQY